MENLKIGSLSSQIHSPDMRTGHRRTFVTNSLPGRADRTLVELERKLKGHDQAIAGILDAIRQLMAPPAPKKRPIGFVTGEKK